MNPEEYRPTPRLRWVKSAQTDPWFDITRPTALKLQQWFGPELPAYMRDDSVGEWRDVVVSQEAP
jgi:hypothetical protein